MLNKRGFLAILYSFILVVFMEFERLFFQNKPFDIYDIIASILGLILIYSIDNKNQDSKKS